MQSLIIVDVMLLCVVLQGCYKMSEPRYTDSEIEAPTARSDGEGDTDSDIGSDVDSAADTDSDTTDDSADPDTVASTQQPVTIRVINNGSHVVYLDSMKPLWGSPAFEDNASMWMPVCAMPCDAVTNEESCCHPCISWLGATAILPGEAQEYLWEGRLFRTDLDRCLCGCAYDDEAMAGEYAIVVGVYDEAGCSETVCDPPVESGITNRLFVSGARRDFEVRFQVPYESPELSIDIPDRIASDGL